MVTLSHQHDHDHAEDLCRLGTPCATKPRGCVPSICVIVPIVTHSQYKGEAWAVSRELRRAQRGRASWPTFPAPASDAVSILLARGRSGVVEWRSGPERIIWPAARGGPVRASPCRGLGPCDTTFRSDSWGSIGSKARNIRVTIDTGLRDSSAHPVEWLRLPHRGRSWVATF